MVYVYILCIAIAHKLDIFGKQLIQLTYLLLEFQRMVFFLNIDHLRCLESIELLLLSHSACRFRCDRTIWNVFLPLKLRIRWQIIS